jgi:hypothetical protein
VKYLLLAVPSVDQMIDAAINKLPCCSWHIPPSLC